MLKSANSPAPSRAYNTEHQPLLIGMYQACHVVQVGGLQEQMACCGELLPVTDRDDELLIQNSSCSYTGPDQKGREGRIKGEEGEDEWPDRHRQERRRRRTHEWRAVKKERLVEREGRWELMKKSAM